MAVLLAGSYNTRAAYILSVLACFAPCSVFRAGRALSVAQAAPGIVLCCAKIRVASICHCCSEMMHISLQFNLI